MFVSDLDGNDVALPSAELGLKKSQCTPLFMEAYTRRKAGAVIHTHSQNAVMVTLMNGSEFRINHQEMIKGIMRDQTGSYHKYYDTLVVPIIDNTPEEADLAEWLAAAMDRYPETCAVLVRRHGVYVWGPTWQKAKVRACDACSLMDCAESHGPCVLCRAWPSVTTTCLRWRSR